MAAIATPEAAPYYQGKGRRQALPRSVHAEWSPPANRADPVAIVEAQDAHRMPSLVPIRHKRMSRSPFTFFRGSAAIMAADLANTLVTGSLVQACGDSHLSNFGAFATPERNLIFDVNDFDETVMAPWEWDVKRLAASAVLAARELDLSEKRCRKAALTAVCSYRESMHVFAAMTTLDVWYSRIDATDLVERMNNAPVCKEIAKEAERAHHHAHEHISPKLVSDDSGAYRIIDDEPLIFHFVADERCETEFRQALTRYAESLRTHIRILYQRYHEVDLAMKVVGVGSVGTRCAVALFQAGQDDLLILQIKEATKSVLETYGRYQSGFENEGQRCVVGQRLAQSASDLFLGWTSVDGGYDYYVRQLRDMKAGVDLTRMRDEDLQNYAALCGETLARGHARSGAPAYIAGYLGQSDRFDEAVADFAMAYADQTDSDYRSFINAIDSGRVTSSEFV